MTIASTAVSIVLALLLAGTAVRKLRGTDSTIVDAHRVGVSPTLNRFIGVCEAAAAAGLTAGLFWLPLGIAAAGGVALLMIGAIIAHGRVHDPASRLAPALLVFLLSLAALTITVCRLRL